MRSSELHQDARLAFVQKSLEHRIVHLDLFHCSHVGFLLRFAGTAHFCRTTGVEDSIESVAQIEIHLQGNDINDRSRFALFYIQLIDVSRDDKTLVFSGDEAVFRQDLLHLVNHNLLGALRNR